MTRYASVKPGDLEDEFDVGEFHVNVRNGGYNSVRRAIVHRVRMTDENGNLIGVKTVNSLSYVGQAVEDILAKHNERGL